ncbi:MAG: isoleucine--tRNA ligase [Vampirovibrio sp.]|nr:isoleucine--tRNA ligase [Vampirovibrio sp.]
MSNPPVQEKNYKETLNLPQTGFKMKAGAATREPEIEAFWDENKVYETAQQHRDKNHKFVLHDGPPYLSSDRIHIGTALNKILKDIITRYKYMRGYYSPYVPGYDGHGLPIENAVVKKIKGGKHAISGAELRKKCREFAKGNLKGQEENFRRLGVWGDWEHPYITIDAEFEAIQTRLFADMYKKGYVYKGLKPVYWCPTCETALADAEVEYGDHESHSIYVKFPIDNLKMQCENWPSGHAADYETWLSDASFVIWTTTPWTLPANLALSVHEDFDYAVIKTDAWGKLILADKLVDTFATEAGIETYEKLGTLKGKFLEMLVARHPFVDRDSIVLNGDHVTLEAGTGIVHTAPGHGMEDYVVVQQYNRQRFTDADQLPILSPVDDRGCFTAQAGLTLQGLEYHKANSVILDMLREKSALIYHATFHHSYPHCWRCHRPVIYRATDQWFIAVEKFRAQALKEIKNVTWIPARGEARLSTMVENRTDWCISRQRVWGVPIPVFYCKNKDCRADILNDETTEKVYQLFSAHSSDAWWEKSAEEILGADFQCPKCKGAEFDKEMDIMDVWFDSGVSHTTVVKERKDELGDLPVELYLEGSDQHRGWFQSALLTSVMVHGAAPYKNVLTHGFVLDQDGRKMSKSLGNVMEPQKVINQLGADVLRLWVASVDYSVDVRIGDEIVSQLAEVYRKVRNTVRYMLGNLADFEPDQHRVAYDDLSNLDRYTLHRLHTMVGLMTDAFDRYEFHRFYQQLQNFCVVDLSSFYFDVMKDTLYTYAKDHPSRRGVQTVLHELLITLLPMLVPVMPHMADDIWMSLPEVQKPKMPDGAVPVSATLMSWPEVNTQWVNDELAESFENLARLREVVNLALEKPRSTGKIGSSLAAGVHIATENPLMKNFLHRFSPEELAALLIVSEVYVAEDKTLPEGLEVLSTRDVSGQYAVTAFVAPGQKCPRCWKYRTTIGQHADHPEICHTCTDAVVSASA